MFVRVLGCHGGIEPGYETSCYLVDNLFLIDCGSACSALSPQEQVGINNILITHPHLDHIKDIAFLLENTFSAKTTPLVLHSTEAILNDIKNHLLNDIVWPDFSTLYLNKDEKIPSLIYSPIKDSLTLKSLKITPFKVNHPGHAVGYLIDNGNEQVIFTGDSGPCATIWNIANQCSSLQAIFTEISFPNRMEALAKVSGHYTLEHLIQDHSALEKKEIPIYISHFKPAFFQELMKEFHDKAPPCMKLLHENDELLLDEV